VNPVALQPAAANDARPSRPTYFTTRDGAESYARRLARGESPTATITGVPFVRGLFRPIEGGKAFEVRLAHFGDYEVREVTQLELARRQQAGMRADVARLIAQAEEYEAKAATTRMVSLKEQRLRYARSARQQAREIALQLTISLARPAEGLADDIEPRFSGERDSREAVSL